MEPPHDSTTNLTPQRKLKLRYKVYCSYINCHLQGLLLVHSIANLSPQRKLKLKTSWILHIENL